MHGFQLAFYALAATAAAGAAIAALLIEPQPAQAEPQPQTDERQVAVGSQYTPVCHETTTRFPLAVAEESTRADDELAARAT